MDLVEINGERADASDLGDVAFAGYGHFTSMQTRDRAVRGLDLHLERLRAGSRELFGADLDPDRVRSLLHQATSQADPDASVRIVVFSSDGDAVWDGRSVDPDVLIAVGRPAPPPSVPLRVRITPYERLLPHLKHVATLGLTHHARQARLAGFDDALFVDQDGSVSEGSIWNVAFLLGDEVVWPSAPKLDGITMLLVQRGLAATGVSSSTRAVHASEFGTYRAAAAMNSITVGQPIVRVGEIAYDIAACAQFQAILRIAYERNPWDRIDG